MPWKHRKTNMLCLSEDSEAEESHRQKLLLLERMASSEVALKRFWEKVDRSNSSGCWNWLYAVNRRGYGIFGVPNPQGKQWCMTAHRISYFLKHRTLPPLLVCHTCDNRRCVNPDHFFIGTYTINRADCVKKGRQAVGSAVQGSRLSEEQVVEIRRRYFVEHASWRSLAENFGVTFKAIQDITNRYTWKHLPYSLYEL